MGGSLYKKSLGREGEEDLKKVYGGGKDGEFKKSRWGKEGRGSLRREGGEGSALCSSI